MSFKFKELSEDEVEAAIMLMGIFLLNILPLAMPIFG